MNPFRLSRPQADPYAIYVVGTDTCHVIRTYKSTESEKTDIYARWEVAVVPDDPKRPIEQKDMYVAELLNNGKLVAATPDWQEYHSNSLTEVDCIPTPIEYLSRTKKNVLGTTQESHLKEKFSEYKKHITNLFLNDAIKEAAKIFSLDICLEIDKSLKFLDKKIHQKEANYNSLSAFRKLFSPIPERLEILKGIKDHLLQTRRKIEILDFYEAFEDLGRPRVRLESISLFPFESDILQQFHHRTYGAKDFFEFLFFAKLQQRFSKLRPELIEPLEKELFENDIYPGEHALYYWLEVVPNTGTATCEYQLAFDCMRHRKEISFNNTKCSRSLNARKVPDGINNSYTEIESARTRYFDFITQISGLFENLDNHAQQSFREPADFYVTRYISPRKYGIAPKIELSRSTDGVAVQANSNFLPGLKKFGLSSSLDPKNIAIDTNVGWETIKNQLVAQFSNKPISLEKNAQLDHDTHSVFQIRVEFRGPTDELLCDCELFFTYPIIKFLETDHFEHYLSSYRETFLRPSTHTKDGDLEAKLYAVVQQMLRSENCWAVYPVNLSLAPFDVAAAREHIERHMRSIISEIAEVYSL
jgi:hypothetical protein